MPKNDFSIEIAENYEQKCLCVLILDISSSMEGTNIDLLNMGLQNFYDEISNDETTSQRLEVSIIACNNVHKTIIEPTLVENFTMPVFCAHGAAHIVDAVYEAIEKVEARKRWYKSTGQPYYRPWIILMTDGVFDSGQDFLDLSIRIKEDTKNKKYEFMPIGIGDANMETLEGIKGNLPPKNLHEVKFSSFFKWLSASMGTIMSSEEDLTFDLNGGTDNWMEAFTIGSNDNTSTERNNQENDYRGTNSDIIIDDSTGFNDWMDAFSIDDNNNNDVQNNYKIEEEENKPTYIPQLQSEKENLPNNKGLVKKIYNILSCKNASQDVFCSVFTPAEISKKTNLLVQVYFHLKKEIGIITQLASMSDKHAVQRGYHPLKCKLKKGDIIEAELIIYGDCLLANVKKKIVWEGKFVNCPFNFYIAENIMSTNLFCKVIIYTGDLPIGEICFTTAIVSSPSKTNAKNLVHTFNRIFISYAHQDAHFANKLALAYKAQGVDYFFDHDKLKPGDVFEDIIFRYIDISDLFILCWSKNAAYSEYVSKERSYAMSKAYPQQNLLNASIKIYPISISPRAEIPQDMKDIYHFEIMEDDFIESQNEFNVPQLPPKEGYSQISVIKPWVVANISSWGDSHKSLNIPCQDYHAYEPISDGWGIAVISDGAGSAKYSHYASLEIVHNAIRVFKDLVIGDFIKNQSLPTDREWSKKAYQSLVSIKGNLVELCNKNMCNKNDLNATIIVVIHSPNGLLVTHIGDGRAGYKNQEGEWFPLITPHKGEYANQTVFLSSDIWNTAFCEVSGVPVPESIVVREKVSAFTLMSDGCENSAWLCNTYDQIENKYHDPNIPFKTFLDSIVLKVKSHLEFDDNHVNIKKMLYEMIQCGNNYQVKESDDKTLIVGFLG